MYQLLREPNLGDAAVRDVVIALSTNLALRLHEQLRVFPENKVLLIPILRGGLLMYPAFAKVFRSAAVGLVQIAREGEGRKVIYESLPQGIQPEVILFLDPVAGTGGTIERAARLARDRYGARKHVACVITAARDVRGSLRTEEVSLEGVSTEEENLDGLVIPDLGERDAGDLACLPAKGPLLPNAFPIAAFEQFHADDDRAKTLRSELIYEPILEIARSNHFLNILDLGCGAGNLTKAMAKYADNVVGYDPSEEAIDLARKKNDADNVSFTTLPPDLNRGKFDLVACCMVLNSTHEFEGVVELAAKCSAPNSLQVWTVLHPAFQFNESQWRARKCISPANLSVSFSLLPSYFDEHTFGKRLGDLALTEYHRPLSTYINTFAKNGFYLMEMREPRAVDVSPSIVDYFVPRTIMFVTRGPLTQENHSEIVPNYKNEVIK